MYLVDLNEGTVEEGLPFPMPSDTASLGMSSCGVATRSDGTRIFVTAGGEDTSTNSRDEVFVYEIDVGGFWYGS